MTVHYEPHRITGANRLAAVCDMPGCEQALYVDGAEWLRRLGWRVEAGDEPRALCPGHGEGER